MLKLSDYLMNFLVSKGVSKVFMLPGGGAMHLNDSLGRCNNLEYICFLHESFLNESLFFSSMKALSMQLVMLIHLSGAGLQRSGVSSRSEADLLSGIP